MNGVLFTMNGIDGKKKGELASFLSPRASGPGTSWPEL
jgi:hypothetical protein